MVNIDFTKVIHAVKDTVASFWAFVWALKRFLAVVINNSITPSVIRPRADISSGD